jgi:hypothetical protein
MLVFMDGYCLSFFVGIFGKGLQTSLGLSTYTYSMRSEEGKKEYQETSSTDQI